MARRAHNARLLRLGLLLPACALLLLLLAPIKGVQAGSFADEDEDDEPPGELDFG